VTTSKTLRWGLIVALLLVSWGLRLVQLEEVPPGWRDDELINIHALSNQLLEGRFPLYYPGASGHEPLYHHLHAGVHVVLGFNVLSGHILSVMFGTLSIALTYSLIRRLFPGQRTTAVVASLTLATSFWSLMYSRTAIRHISLPPFALATLYLFWRQLDAEEPSLWGWGLTGLLSGLSLYTYTASRLLPVLLGLFVVYLVLFHRVRVRKHWRGLALSFLVMAVLAAPLGIVIARNRSRNAIEGIGADARVTELAGPLRALQDGDPVPVIVSTLKTLGMFHASGDPEWLYNIPDRPVFNLLGGVLLWTGVALCLYRWRKPRCFFLLAWLAVGLSPAFISTPPASLGHTILAQPVAYILPALALTAVRRIFHAGSASRRRSLLVGLGSWSLILLFVTSNAARDLGAYFGTWPEEAMVRVLYRADYRDIAGHLDARPELAESAVSSTLLGPWDRLALDVDTQYDDADVRLFDPGRALVWTADQEPSSVLLTPWPEAGSTIGEVLKSHSILTETLSPRLRRYEVSPLNAADPSPGQPCYRGTRDEDPYRGRYRFDNGLELTGACWVGERVISSGGEVTLITTWAVVEPLDLPPAPIVANPPPPGVRTGPRLSVFAHIMDSANQTDEPGQADSLVAADDGLWVDPLTLEPGDRFMQVHRFDLGEDEASGSYVIALGLYDPMTGERRVLLDSAGRQAADRVIIRASGP
jgi:4-amino-4-deoxy-L-arabinose transferase-like glycosyltransferase